MANLAFISPPLLGHLNPMIALARAALASAHRVTFVGIEDLRPKIEAAGGEFLAIGRSYSAGELHRIRAKAGAVRGLANLGPVVRDMARLTDTLCRELPAALSRNPVDAIVCDQLEPAGGLIAAHMSLPQVSIANALLINRDDAVPPFFTPWLPESAAWARRTYRGAHQIADLMQWRHARVISHWARKWRLGRRRSCHDCLSPATQISQIVPGFDFPREKAVAGLAYCGPFRDKPEAQGLPFERSQGKPYVFASLGTLFGGRFDIFQAIAQACASLGVELVLTHGGRLSDAQCKALPGTTHAFSNFRQEPVIAQAALCITHAGMNTVLDALTGGVPILAMPVAFDQPGVSARVVWSGSGERLQIGRLSTELLRTTIARVLTEPRYRANSCRLAAQVQEAGGAARAVELIEATLTGAQRTL